MPTAPPRIFTRRCAASSWSSEAGRQLLQAAWSLLTQPQQRLAALSRPPQLAWLLTLALAPPFFMFNPAYLLPLLDSRQHCLLFSTLPRLIL